MSTRLVAKFYNVQVSRDIRQVTKELEALLGSEPDVLGLCETTGYQLPTIEGYRLLRDTSTRSRANISCYVTKARSSSSVEWYDCQQTWSRTEHPGTHEPRSWLHFRLEQVQIIVGHQPPKGTDNTLPAQREGIEWLTPTMAPWKREDWSSRSKDDKADAKDCPRLAVADWNRRPTETGPGPGQLATEISGYTMGARIDGGVCRGNDCEPRSTEYVHKPQGVTLRSDHPEAAVMKLDVADRWVK